MSTHNEPDLIVSGDPESPVNSLAGALASTLREKGFCSLQGMGPGAVNKAVKAIIIANGYLGPSGFKIVDEKFFVNVVIDGEKRTAIRFSCEMVSKE